MKKIMVVIMAIGLCQLIFAQEGGNSQTSEEKTSTSQSKVTEKQMFPSQSTFQRIYCHLIDNIVFETLPEEEKKALEKLRIANPDEFKKEVKVKIKERRKYLKKLKQKNPEKFKEIM